MDDAFAAQPNEPIDGDKAQYDIAVTAVTDFLGGQSGWYSISSSGHAVQEDGDPNDRPHLAINISPAATPYGVEDTSGTKPGKPKG
jgi:hypothetical protein